MFVNKAKISDKLVEEHLKENKVEVRAYEEIVTVLEEIVKEKKKIGLDENVCN